MSHVITFILGMIAGGILTLVGIAIICSLVKSKKKEREKRKVSDTSVEMVRYNEFCLPELIKN